jgi:ATP-dependent DNA helicase RecG
MRLDAVEHAVARGESETVEFKASTAQLRESGEVLCSFLNANGGTVYIGVNAGGRIIGQLVADRTQQDIANTLRKIEPPAPIDIDLIELPNTNRHVIVLRAAEASETLPFTFDGRPYQRIGTTTSIMPQERYEQVLLQRLHGRSRWENTPALVTRIRALDREEILRTARIGVAAGRLPESTGGNIADIVERMGLIVRGQLLNAAVVLFGNEFLPDYPQCQLRMARFKGVSKTEFLDQRQIHGHAFALLDEALLFLRRHLPVAGRIQPGIFERADEPLFPLVALREALVNAICHRDYTYAGGAVSLAIYDDRLEIWSAGTLPFGLHVDDLKRDHQSRPRNPVIAEVFYRRGLVERWGRGTQKIVELCVEAGHPEPEFVEQAGAVGVRFFPSGYIAPHRVGVELTARQREILQVLAEHETAPLRVVMEELSNPPSSAAVRVDLAHLRRAGLVSSQGHGRGAVWFLIHQVEE